MRAFFLSVVLISSCAPHIDNRGIGGETAPSTKIKEQLLSLERKWLEAEFVLDTAWLSTLLDATFIGISPGRVPINGSRLSAYSSKLKTVLPPMCSTDRQGR